MNFYGLEEPVKKGMVNSVKMLWLLIKVVIPISCLILIMQRYGILEAISHLFSPAMSLVGLPGEAAIVLVLGFFLNFYAAIGAIINLSLSSAQLTIVAVMLAISHSLPLESAICVHTGLKIPVSMTVRIVVAFFAGAMMNIIYHVVLKV